MLSPIADVEHWSTIHKLLIFPLAGEMSGRTEGGARELDLRPFATGLRHLP
ncbi:hypothetical protein X740_30030 [Mesorhizobium sp. LNHC221B00]|nr:hypothetical protein X740_30030 [Mesorhizobium sp. LNHC221B00]